ncbi:MAG: holin [Bacillota bacterium]|nr:holin [Bacillota bacterium]
MKQNRLKSIAVWATLLPILLFIGSQYGLFQFIGLTKESFSELWGLVMAALAAFGILNNPTDKSTF